MTLLSHTRFFRALLLIILGMVGFAGRMVAADAPATNTAADADAKAAEAAVVGNQESLRSYLQLQDLIHNTQLTIEKNRQEAEAAAIHNAELLQAHLDGIQRSFASQHLDDLKRIEKENHSLFLAAGGFLIAGFLVLLIAVFLQWSVVKRLSSITTSLPAGHLLGQGSTPAALGMGEGEMLPAQALELSTTRFLGLVERLEQRISDMESGIQPRPHLIEAVGANGEHGDSNGSTNGNGNGNGVELAEGLNGETAPPAFVDKAGTITMLLGKGQTLLKLDKPEAALACFDEVLALDPDHAEALVKKGAAFERLQRLVEAVECYDRAIAADSSMTMAYLYKGGVFNRMERYTEALECYERALKTQDKARIPDVMRS